MMSATEGKTAMGRNAAIIKCNNSSCNQVQCDCGDRSQAQHSTAIALPTQASRIFPLATLFALALLTTNIYSAPPFSISATNTCGYVIIPEWFIYSLLAISIGVFVYALLYMLGSLLNRPQVKGMVRAGIADIAGLFIILIAAYAVNTILCNANFSSVGIDLSANPAYSNLYAQMNAIGIPLNNLNFFQLAELYLETLYYLGEKFYRMLLVQILMSGAMMSVKVNQGANLGDMSAYNGIEPIMNLGPTLFSTLTIGIISVSAQYYLLKLFLITGMQLFFPLGVLMRTIPATRSFGAALIGLAVSVYLFYPLMLSYNFLILASSTGFDVGQVNSMLYNAPSCSDATDCQQNCNSEIGLLDPATKKYTCSPCVLSGPPPNGDSTLCCKKVSELKGSTCEIKSSINQDNPDSMGRGGIIAQGATPTGYIATMGIGAIAGMSAISLAASKIPKVGTAVTAITGAFTVMFQLGATFLGRSFLGFLVNPISLFIAIMFFNSQFLFLGFILPMIEFVVMVELVRTVTASMGEPIDVVQLLKVI